MLERLARWCYRHRWRVLIFWIVALVGVSVISQRFGEDLDTDFTLPDSEAQRVFELLEERFPSFAGDQARIVFKAPKDISDPAIRQPMTRLFADIEAQDHVADVQSPYEPGIPAVSSDRRVAIAQVSFDVRGPDVPRELVLDIKDRVEQTNVPGVAIELGGQAVRFAEQEGPGNQESIGILAAVVILLVTFGSVIAMGLPIMTAIFGLGIGIALISLFAHFVDIPEFAPQLAAMIGLGVGIDYALFIVTRYRQALHAGRDPEESIVLALNTAGRAVIFAGITVVISLLGLFLIGLEFVRGLAIGASSGVFVTMIASITLLPSVLGFVGRTIDRLHVPFLHRDESDHRASFWFRWSRLVQRRPLPAVIAGSALLVVLAIPLFSIRLGFSDEGNDPTTSTTRRAYELVSEGFGPGFNGPLIAVARVDGPADRTALNGLSLDLRKVAGVQFVSPPRVNPQGNAAVMIVIPKSAPQSKETQDLVGRLRSQIPRLTGRDGPDVLIGGITAAFIDMSDYLERRLPYFIAAVVVLSFILLMFVFRSLLIPLKAAIVNMLGIGAAYGVVVAIFQWGWLKDVVGIERTGPIEPFLPMMLFAILFGLSMDYEVFLMSRIREEYLRVRKNDIAVADGLAATARVITAAAAIMVTVFLSFVLGDDRVVKLFGLGLAVAIFLDATLIRLVVVPSMMELLGDANWWLPRWLDRIIPRVSLDEAPPDLEPVLVAARSEIAEEIERTQPRPKPKPVAKRSRPKAAKPKAAKSTASNSKAKAKASKPKPKAKPKATAGVSRTRKPAR